MYFTSGSDRAFEQLMQGKPGFDHYDSGEAVTPEDCGTCRFYRPHWKYQFCVYAECPYQPGKLTAYDAVRFRVKGVENMAVFRVERNKGYTVMSNHHLSDTVIVPIAAAILAVIMCYELIDMIVEKNNMHDFDTSMFFRWIFKSAFTILIVTNTWNIVMGVFDATQAVVNQSAGVIIGETSIDFDTLIPDLEHSGKQRLHLPAQSGVRRPAHPCGAIEHFPAAVTVCG